MGVRAWHVKGALHSPHRRILWVVSLRRPNHPEEKMFAAGKRELEIRFWIFCLTFFTGFALYAFDPVNMVVWLAQRITPCADLNPAAA